MGSIDQVPPFPDVPCAALKEISLQKLVDDDQEESQKLFAAAKDLGFIYLALDSEDGRELLEESDGVFRVATRLAAIPRETAEKFRSQDNVIGFKAQKWGDPSANRTVAFNTAIDDLLNGSKIDYMPPVMSEPEHKKHLCKSARLAQGITTLIVKHLERKMGITDAAWSKLHAWGHPKTSSHLSITITFPEDRSDPRRAFNAHSDHGTATLVLHKVLGGLQVLVADTKDGVPSSARWEYVKPMAGYAIVNLGDVLTLLSNGVLRSNVHRVVTAPGDQARFTRHSLVYFLYPVDDYHVPCENAGEADHVPLTFKEFISRRLGIGVKPGDEHLHNSANFPGVFGQRQRKLLELAGQV